MATQAKTTKPAQPVKSGKLAGLARVIAAAAPAVVTAVGVMVPHRTVSPPPAAPAITLSAPAGNVPVPLLAKGHPVQWFFVFKLNAAAFRSAVTMWIRGRARSTAR